MWKFRPSRLLPKERNNKTYIIPTSFGALFGLLCLILLYSAFATGNNFMYLYTFFISGIGFTSLWLTHANIADVTIEVAEAEDVFAGDRTYAQISVKNLSSSSKYFITAYCHKDFPVLINEIPPRAQKTVRVYIGEFPRGLQNVPPLKLSTVFPFRLFKSWKNAKAEAAFHVFPRREGKSHLPMAQSRNESAEGRTIDQVRSPEAEFTGHRKFETSDSARQIDWKAYARTQRLLVKDYQSYREQIINIQWEKTGNLKSFEDRLSQMALWIELSEMKGFFYSFEFGGKQIASSRGRSHYLACLKLLAEANEETFA